MVYQEHGGRKLSSDNRGGQGFTLLELVVVMTLLAIISAAVVPIYANSMAAIQMRGAGNDFVARLSFVQEKAVAESCEYRLYIDDKAGTYWVAVLTGTEKGEKVFEPVDADYGRRTTLPEFLKLERIKARKDRELKAYYITCYPNGACDRAKVRFQDERSQKHHLEIETLGTMGKIDVKRGDRRVIQ